MERFLEGCSKWDNIGESKRLLHFLFIVKPTRKDNLLITWFIRLKFPRHRWRSGLSSCKEIKFIQEFGRGTSFPSITRCIGWEVCVHVCRVAALIDSSRYLSNMTSMRLHYVSDWNMEFVITSAISQKVLAPAGFSMVTTLACPFSWKHAILPSRLMDEVIQCLMLIYHQNGFLSARECWHWNKFMV